MKVLQVLLGHLTGFHNFIAFLNSDRKSSALMSLGISSYISGAKCESVSLPLSTEFTDLKLKVDLFLII